MNASRIAPLAALIFFTTASLRPCAAQNAPAAEVAPATLLLTIERGAHIAILGGTLMEPMQEQGWLARGCS